MEDSEYRLVESGVKKFDHIVHSTDGSLRRLARLVLRIAKTTKAGPVLIFLALSIMEDILGVNDPDAGAFADQELLRERARLFFPSPANLPPAPTPAASAGADAPAAGKPKTVLASLGPNETDVFLRLMRTGDMSVQRTTAMVLALLLAAVPAQSDNATSTTVYVHDEPAVEALAAFLAEQLAVGARSAHVTESSVVDYLPALAVLLRRPAARSVFFARGGVAAVSSVLQALLVAGTNSQLTYEATFCMWALALLTSTEEEPASPRPATASSSTPSVAAAVGPRAVVREFLTTGAVRSTISAVAAAPSRKVVRMAVAALRTLARRESPELLTEMLTCGLDKLLSNMVHANAHTQSGDADVEQDVVQLHQCLLRNYRELTAFDKWAAEVSTGQLRWGIVHTDAFWKENAAHVEKDDFHNLRQLVKIISSSADQVGEEALCVALYDLGQFARRYPNGRGVLKALGAREIVMRMVEHPSLEVQRHALQCVSKLMIQNWDHIK